jgi:RelA/SpoT family (p)ppGpp synthetase
MDKQHVLDHAKLHYGEDQLSLLDRSIDMASTAHAGQKRLSGDAYITHPLQVADMLIDWGMDIDSVIAGVLHDTIEDTDLTLEAIEAEFGRDVAFLVDGVTKVSKVRAGMRNLDSYLPQTKDNLSKLLIAIGQDVRVVIIKLADRLHNLMTLQQLPPEKRIKIARESLEVFAPTADRLGMGRVRMQIEELAFSYLDPTEYKRLQAVMKRRLGKSTRKLGRVRQEVEAELKKSGINYKMDGRVKSIFSLYKKLRKVQGNMDDIYDLMALRIVVDSKEDCYKVLGILHSLYQPMIARIKDYIATPKPNGYQSLHTTVLTPTKQIVEFQVRTREMHEYAERGLAASFHYHEQKNSKNYIRKKGGDAALPPQLQWITQLQEVASHLRSGEDIPREQLYVDLFSDRIFVYSPKGDIYNLPEGALPLDFAYLVHSDIGNHAYSFRVNGKIYPFDKPLKNGDMVEVVTRKSQEAKADWLDLVTTSHARDKIRSQLNKKTRSNLLMDAAELLQGKPFRKNK